MLPSIALLALGPLAFACNPPLAEGEDPNCAKGNFTDCYLYTVDFCNLECLNQPPGQCLSGCQTRAQVHCQAACMPINNCEDCIERLSVQGVPEETAREDCSQEGEQTLFPTPPTAPL